MRLSSIVGTAAIFLTSVSAVSVQVQRDEDHSQDGIYTSSGRVGDIVPRDLTTDDNSNPRKLFSRGSYGGVGCDNDANGNVGFNPQLEESATRTLKTFCSIARNGECEQSIWAKTSDTTVFFCKWRNSARFNAGSLDNVLGMVADQCATGNEGSYSDADEEHRTYSYGVTNWKRAGWCNLLPGSTA